MRNRVDRYLAGVASCLMLLGLALPAGAADLDEALEKATRAALEKASPWVVRIDTVGGLEVIKPGVRKGEGATTGVIVDKDGYIISSSFNFAHLPKDKAAVFVRIPGHKDPVNATIVATDETRMLTLIKVDVKDLPVPERVAKGDVRIGQWALAVGRTWSDVDNPSPSVSVGIISAADRIWGRAFQTDAKTSPVNYGGPLLDIHGRAIGVIVPLSPRAADETAGYEWYDGGIGFAVPMDDVYRVLPDLKAGKNIKQGVLGVSFRDAQDFSAPVIGNVAPGSPAAAATGPEGEKLQAGDKILEIGYYDSKNQKLMKKVNNLAQVKHQIFNKYPGDKVTLIIERGDKKIEFADIVLAEQSPSRPIAFLGILPMRDDDQPGVQVRYVYEKSGAAEAKIVAGDRILKVEGQAIAGRDALAQRLGTLAPGQSIKIDLKRKDGKEEQVTVKLGDLADAVAIPKDLPKASLEKAKFEAKEVKKGMFTVKTDEGTGHEYWAFVPDNYDPKKSYALLIWLHPLGDDMQRFISAVWTGKEEICQKNDIILLAPKAAKEEWTLSEVEAIKADIRDMLKNYNIDRQRIVAHGQGLGASVAFYLAFDARDLVRGVAAIGGVLRNDPKPVVANQRLSFFLIAGARDPNIEAVKTVKTKVALHKYPHVYHELPDHGNGYLEARHADILRELVRWIDSLDRL